MKPSLAARKEHAPHGTPGGYTNWGCRCELCRVAARCAREAWLERLQDRFSSEIPHGTGSGYRNWRCRCLECVQARRDGK